MKLFKPKQWLFIKIIMAANIIFISWEFLRHKIYWIGWELSKPQTWWQKALDILHNRWAEMPTESQALFVFIIAGIIFFILSIIMD